MSHQKLKEKLKWSYSQQSPGGSHCGRGSQGVPGGPRSFRRATTPSWVPFPFHRIVRRQAPSATCNLRGKTALPRPAGNMAGLVELLCLILDSGWELEPDTMGCSALTMCFLQRHLDVVRIMRRVPFLVGAFWLHVPYGLPVLLSADSATQQQVVATLRNAYFER